MEYRHEIKYLINEGDAALLRQRLSTVMHLDPHAVNGEYHIRSLYFDDMWNSAYQEKVDGTNLRKKYRIRVYNKSNSRISLECKTKVDSYVAKQTAPLTPRELERLMHYDYSFLLGRENPLYGQFYYELTAKQLRPRVYVDYEREPFVMEAGTVRITLDKNVRGAYPGFGMFDDSLTFQHVLEPGKLVLEVKFTEFLPTVVQEILPSRAQEMTAVSKYVLCAEKFNYLTADPSLF